MLGSLFYKVRSLQACNCIKKRLLQRYFHVKFVKFLRTGFIKSTDPTTNRPPTTYSLTHRPPTHQPTDPTLIDPTDKILSKRLDKRKISVLQNTNRAGKMLNCILRSITYFMNHIYL